MFVLTIDQQDSRTSNDAVPEALAVLSSIPTLVPFARTIGDEVQGVLDDAHAVAEAVRRLAVEAGWHIGIGIGAVDEPLPESTTEGRGPAFYAARQAVEAAKTAPANLIVRSDPSAGQSAASEAAVNPGSVDPSAEQSTAPDAHRRLAEASLRLLVSTLAELRVHSRGYVNYRLDHPEATQNEIAARFDVSQQAVSRVLAPGIAEIVAGAEDLARHHLGLAEGADNVD
ncbi:MarR family transcriptional regulator [Brevibacterium spongiae]|uniref:Uncharacterized protein n=1 Tax=Brevibacterium spongiae TaxID=2909672 RepID=A0ABY5SKM6_9MICO|nr:helix-turn-helix domain-containing protein [Brevibacterium spongiae]UVI34840.1 hypothetical protein L1F31_11970 [Brevibacterium spongiae]